MSAIQRTKINSGLKKPKLQVVEEVKKQAKSRHSLSFHDQNPQMMGQRSEVKNGRPHNLQNTLKKKSIQKKQIIVVAPIFKADLVGQKDGFKGSFKHLSPKDLNFSTTTFG